MQTMFRKRKQDSVDGEVCPYCEFVNPEGADQCAQCYYSLNKSARDQPMATPSSSGNELMATLMSDEGFDEEEEIAVEAVLSMGEVTVDIDQGQLLGEEDGEDLGFIKAGNPTLSETVEYETPDEIELDSSDAPATPVEFEIEAHDPMSEVAEPVHTGLGNLYSPMNKTESDDDLMGSVGPAAGTVAMTPELPDLPGEEAPASVPLPVAKAVGQPMQEPIQPVVATPDLPDTDAPATDVAPVAPHVAQATSQPETPELPDDAQHEPAPEAPEPQNASRIWPWPAKESWDPRQVYREVVAVMEAIKAGKLPEAAQTLDRLGPHLEGNLDMLLHIGMAMRHLGREEHLQWTLAMAQHVHPNDEHVTAAVAQLSKGA